MKKLLLTIIIFLTSLSLFAQSKKIAIVIHGGAGVIKRENMTPEKDKAYREKLDEALNAGYSILENGGTSEEAVISAIMILENSPLFNAGKGAVLTHNEECELDASIMFGKNLNAGAVAGVKTVKNPILAAQAVMHNSKHVMLSGKGADTFAEEQNLELVEANYFITERRHKSLLKAKELEQSQGYIERGNDEGNNNFKYGTVGAVALDQSGNIVAGTSTGGMTNKKYGRVGDSPIIGAGTYANNNTCGISCTGHGEYFIRLGVAKDVSDQMKYQNKSIEEASEHTIQDQLTEIGGTGGLVGLDKDGNIVMEFNTPGMFRGYKKTKETTVVKIYKGE
ncbi:isoaspartyl peptidase/L-asparaginase family protein [Sediminitomix flava]|uniref:Isoaspartyl peptidase n=1 Tax=Sediminitomix flava TaxID=379075 RepID=A0A315Z740_SEDFL|nr:isoaspartyl peptidase/L-asparaginase [Sediminitomix flava]PWJ40032.1 beta-aspartyl-peptidase (threonine type) [Sediminitomix flava]